ncbi:zinc finger protein 236 [Drosophila busckii]|nr:zinc finger protein 236 [Drosophila busckii]
MNLDLRKLCRICFSDSPDVDITQHKVVTTAPSSEGDFEEEISISEMMQAMLLNSLDLTTELPMICNACLEECLVHYTYFSKLMIANRQLRQLYSEAQEKRMEVEEAKILQPQSLTAKDPKEVQPTLEVEASITRSPRRLANEDSLIVSEFLPATELNEECQTDLQNFPSFELRTLDYAAVELKHDNLDEYNETNRLLNAEPSGSLAVYKCKYCPLAYASQQFLKTHVRKSHVCKYCTTAFVKVKDLNAHIRDKHTNNHQCVVCMSSFSTSSNLRAHLKRMHGVQLPAQVALLDYRPAQQNK